MLKRGGLRDPSWLMGKTLHRISHTTHLNFSKWLFFFFKQDISCFMTLSFAHSSESKVVQRTHSERTVGVCSCVCLEIIVGGLRERERQQKTVNSKCLLSHPA